MGIAAGAWLGSRRPVVLMQNSGLGTSLNALASLSLMYGFPALLLVTWRGFGGKDAPEHILMGEISPRLLELLGIPHRVLAADSLERDLVGARRDGAACSRWRCWCRRASWPAASPRGGRGRAGRGAGRRRADGRRPAPGADDVTTGRAGHRAQDHRRRPGRARQRLHLSRELLGGRSPPELLHDRLDGTGLRHRAGAGAGASPIAVRWCSTATAIS